MTEDVALFSLDGDIEGDEGDETRDLQTAEGLLALKRLPKVGDTRAIKLAREFRSSAALNRSDPARRKAVAGVSVDHCFPSFTTTVPHGARMVGYFDVEYPEALRTISNPPAVLWIAGELPDPARRVAIVGTRSATPWGLQMAESIAGAACARGVTVVSGLALGIDIAAHRGAILSGGPTIAVLGSGVDNISPREHQRDAEEILSTGGAIISEVPPWTAASPRTLVARNRLQSALSFATIVVQCGVKSGTMSTAKFAIDQQRVLAIPAPPENELTHPEHAGSVSLTQASPAPRILRSRDDLDTLLTEIA